MPAFWLRTSASLVLLLLLGLTSARADYRSAGYAYLSPVPGASYCSPQTSFILARFQNVSPADVTNFASFITVTGASSGPVPGQTHVASDGRTVIFTAGRSFFSSEAVTVTLSPALQAGAAGSVQPFQYQFMVTGYLPASPSRPASSVSLRLAAVPTNLWFVGSAQPGGLLGQAQPGGLRYYNTATPTPGQPGTFPNGVSVPGSFPQIRITTNSGPDAECIFLDNNGGSGANAYNVIFDNTGSPIWYQLTPDARWDMKVQPNGLVTMLTRESGMQFISLDTHYEQVTNYSAVNGYDTDEHEFRVLPDGTYLLIGARYNPVDMSRYVVGGTLASVLETVVQEFTPAGELIFQWRGWDNYDVRDVQISSPTNASIDFPHLNSIEVDTDGQLLISARHLSEVTKVNPDTGDIIWRLGGAHSTFAFTNDPLSGFCNQHCVRTVGKNRYTMFDNGNGHSPPLSRGVEYLLDLTNLTATLTWQFRQTPDVFSPDMGNVQRLTNGNTLINWAFSFAPKLTEVRPDGTKAFEMNWVDQWSTYRVWRCSWQGVAPQPYLIAEPYPDNITLVFNQFGDTNVAFYRIYGGTAPHPTNLLATSGVTLKELTTLQNGSNYFFRVTAVNRQGVEGPYSNEASATANYVKPGQNMIFNGDFSQGTNVWTWTLSNGASAAWAVESGVSHFYITNGTASLLNIQLKQGAKALEQGKKYVLQFDAWASLPRYIEVQAGDSGLLYADFYPYLTPLQKHFQYVFTMAAPTDLNASLMFNLGASSGYSVYLDNVVLFNSPAGDLNQDGQVDYLDLQLLTRDWLKRQNGLSSDLNGDGTVDFNDFSILGDNWTGGN
ncbi:MAG TPA: aryl-sulfate sulfotransferase [Candidatus Acidoferrum sp.]|nr:aryl-sulfate sulfotransferase [Candidatus Acidoferrum sp.]